MSIRNPRVRVVVHPPPNPRDIKSTWGRLREAFVYIQEQRNSTDFSYQELYRLTYNLVMGQQTQMLYSGLEEVVRSHLKHRVDELATTAGSSVRITKLYSEHYEAMLRIRDVMLYLDSRRGRKQKSVFDIGISYFIEEIVMHPQLRQLLQDDMLELVHKFRSNETIDRHLLKEKTAMLVELGVSHEEEEVYVHVFETQFLETTAQFYGDLSQVMLEQEDAVTYLQQVQNCMDRETDLIDHCLTPSTSPKLSQVVYQKLIKDHLADIIGRDSIRHLADEQRMDGLRLLYRLYSRSPQGLAAMVAFVKKHVLETGNASLGDEDLQSESKGPIKLIASFTESMSKHFRILDQAFDNDAQLLRAINSSYDTLLNKHDRIEEYLSMYIDHVIKSSIKEIGEDDIETVLDKAMRVFRLLQEKDVFERYFKQHLAKRLLAKKATTMTHEHLVIQSLKRECGFQYTAKCETMFKDMRVSENLRELFNESEHNTIKAEEHFDFDVKVLATGMWPTQATLIQIFPVTLLRATQAYEKFYQSRHEGRKLTWVNTLGTMSLSAKFGHLTGYHTLATSTSQGLVLLMFNQGVAPPSLSFDAMKESTGLAPVDLKRALQALSQGKAKILIKSTATKAIATTDEFSLNPTFTSKNVRIKIPQLVVKETPIEKESTKAKIDEDRVYSVEATIVRVMKARKKMHHNELVIEVTKLMSQYFTPTPKLIKTRIARLIDAEYIERSSNDQKIYNYLA